jgi:Ca-activated chloride channel homolog
MNRKLLPILLLLLLEVVAGAQNTSIHGIVTDTTRALIPGVTIQLENLDTGEKRTTVSDAAGAFSLVGLSPGKVRVTATLPGFVTWKQEFVLGLQGAQLSVTLKIGSAGTTVEVTASSGSTGSTGGGGGRIKPPEPYRGPSPMNTESYSFLDENPFTQVLSKPRSTFAVDVDTASYANVRRFLSGGNLPPKDAVRIEELMNYFKYDYAVPNGIHPVAIHTEVASPFWAPRHKLVRIGIRARDVDLSARSRANLVFLIDVFGSMMEPNKLPLVQASLHLLVDQLRDDDAVTMVVYAGNSGLVLPPTDGTHKKEIHKAIDRLEAGGSTNGGAGIELAYRKASENFVPGGINRVILATDGDFNVGVTSEGDLVRLIQQKAQSGVFLTVLGFGIGNYNDSTLEKLADKGHGNYAYIDTIAEARRTLVDQLTGNLMTVARDVKLQVEFNPAEVEAYRLIGYENRVLQDADFKNDKKDGGDMGAGHNVTAMFEIIPKASTNEPPEVDALKYQKQGQLVRAPKGELLTVSLRYKLPENTESVLLQIPAVNSGTAFGDASADFRFAASVAAFGMLLRDSPNRGTATIEDVLKIAAGSSGTDSARVEFVGLARKAAPKLRKSGL